MRLKNYLKNLFLIHKIYAEEVAQGLWEKKASKKKTKATEVREQQEKYGQGGLFGE